MIKKFLKAVRQNWNSVTEDGISYYISDKGCLHVIMNDVYWNSKPVRRQLDAVKRLSQQ